MFPSRMTEGCGLSTWYTNSEIVHAVADNPFGPWTVSSTAIPRIFHEGATAIIPGGKGMVAMMHAGCGNATLPVVTNCSGGVTHGKPTKFR